MPEYYSPLFREYLTAGSVTTGSFPRTLAPRPRVMLLDAASQAWRVPLAELTTRDGAVLHQASGQQVW